MGNEKDWEELNKWAEEKEQAKVDLAKERTTNRKLKDNGSLYNILNFIIKFLIIVVSILVIIMYINIIGRIISEWSYFDSILTQDIGKRLEYMYPEYKFNIEELQVDEKGNGLYIASPIDEPDFKFLVYKEKKLVFYTDFDYKMRQYYLKKFHDEDIKKSFKISKASTDYYGYEFLNAYEFWIEINDYNDIEEATRKLYELYQYFNKTVEKEQYKLLMGGQIRQGNDYSSEDAFHYDMSFEELLEREQKAYKNHMRYR